MIRLSAPKYRPKPAASKFIASLAGNGNIKTSTPVTVVHGAVKAGLLIILSVFFLQACTTVSAPVSGDKARDASRFNAELGAKYLQRDDLDQARSKLEKALEQNKKNALAHVTYARLLQRVGDPQTASKHFKRAIALESKVAEHHNAYGIFLCQEGEISLAEKEFKTAADDPYYETPEYALDNAGLCLMDNDNIPGAEKYLRDALRANPRFASALFHMAELTFKQKRLSVAEAYLSRHKEYSNESSRALLLALNIKREMGDSTSAKNLADKLLGSFPGSLEAGEYLARPL